MVINICGDFTTEGVGLTSVLNETAFGQGVLDVFKNGDLNIVNLEAPVVTDVSQKIIKNGPNIKTSNETISYLKNGGINLVTLANNHFYDYGVHGVTSTIEELQNAGISFVGGGYNKEMINSPYIFQKDFTKVTILNYCENEFSTLSDCGSNAFDTIKVYNDLQRLKVEDNVVIVILHGGHEGYNLPSPRMKDWSHFMIDNGADVVIWHHQHCFSGHEQYKEKSIFYGLGNFFFDDFRPTRHRNVKWNFGYILTLDVNALGVKEFNILPYRQCLANNNVDLLQDSEKEKFLEEYNILTDIIRSDGMLGTFFDEFCMKQENNIKASFSPYTNKYLLALCRRGFLPHFLTKRKTTELLNKLCCEAHHDVVENVFKRITGWI